jgi:alditol oxidase
MPTSLEEVQEIVAAADRIHALGSRHSFNDMGEAAELVSLERMPANVVVEGDGVSFNAGLTYGALVRELDGLALHNLASLPHISVGGAVATATHGSGNGNGNLATTVRALELVTSSGEVLRAARGEPEFDGLVVGLGALGVVTRIALDVEPAYEVRQRVFEGLTWDALYEHFDAITASGYSVSVFTRFRETVDQVWVKRRAPDDLDELFGARPATVDRHPILELDPVNTTPQRGAPGPWFERLPHFRMGFTPSIGEELQSEFFVARDDARDAIEAVRGIRLDPLAVSEIRTIAADGLWMSPQYGRETVAIHFTWRLEPEPVLHAVREIEAALAPFAARPHWGKVFEASPAALYERARDFLALRDRLDPRGALRNEWLERTLGA